MGNQVWKTFAAQGVSHSVAHYLTAIHDLQESHGYARVSDVARALQLTKGAVSLQLKHLKERGFVTEDENRFLQLTGLGQSVARDVTESRKLLTRFLTEVLGVSRSQAEEDACKIEHLLSQETGGRLVAFLALLESKDAEALRFVEKFREHVAHPGTCARRRAEGSAGV